MEIKNLKFGEIYLVEVAFKRNNVIHRALAFDAREIDASISFRLFPMNFKDCRVSPTGFATPALLADQDPSNS